MDKPTPPYKILIVDDDKFLLDMYLLKFSQLGYEIMATGNGEEALEKLDAGYRPDIYLIDVLMPKIDGFQLIGKLKERNLQEHAAMIILSNLGQQEDIDRGLALGVDGYIIKATATPSEVVAKAVEIAKSKKLSPSP